MVKLIHMIQHLGSKIGMITSLWIHGDLWLKIIRVPSCNCCRSILLHSSRSLCLLPIILLIHSLVVHVVSILNGKPRILLNLLAILPRLQIKNIILTRLLIVYSALIEIKRAFSVVR